MFFVNNERDDVVHQTLLEHNQSSDTAVAVLKRVNRLKFFVKFQNFIKGFSFPAVICRQKFFHFGFYVFGRTGFVAADFVRKFLVLPDVKPIFAAVARPVFKNKMKFFYHRFRKRLFRVVDNIVDAFEVVCRFDDVIDVERAVFRADCVCFKNISRLLVREGASFDMI